MAYWEPAKFAAKLRELKTDNNLLLLKTNFDAGHAGHRVRYDYLKEIAFKFAFLIDRLAVEKIIWQRAVIALWAFLTRRYPPPFLSIRLLRFKYQVSSVTFQPSGARFCG